jgi:hypothetical protein
MGLLRPYTNAVVAICGAILVPVLVSDLVSVLVSVLVIGAAACGRCERNQPAESQARGMTNSDQPQSRQTRMSGEGVMGG